jgi:excisionase family DNA binding protein
MTPAGLAKKYPVSRSTLYSACQEGLLPHYRLPAKKGKRGKYLIKESDFLAWLESNRHEAGRGASVPLVHITRR